MATENGRKKLERKKTHLSAFSVPKLIRYGYAYFDIIRPYQHAIEDFIPHQKRPTW